jgi:hypothetical protein
LLEPTIAEKEGFIDREKLLAISGRNRQPQIELAKKFGVKDYPSPAGGCALTQAGFVERFKELMKHQPDFNSEDVDLVKIGRHFFIEGTQIILGRNEQENQILKSVAKKIDILIEPDNFIGPTGFIRGGKTNKAINKTRELIIKFSPKTKNIAPETLTFKSTPDFGIINV